MRRLHSYVCVYVSETSHHFSFSFRVVWCVLHTSSRLDVTSSFDTKQQLKRRNVPHSRKIIQYSHPSAGQKKSETIHAQLTRQRPTQSCRCNISSGPLDGFDTENFWATTRWCCSANKRISSCLLSCHFKGVFFFFYDRLKFAKSSFPCQRLRVTVFMETGVKILQLLFCVRARCSRATATKFRVNICRNRRTRHCVYV